MISNVISKIFIKPYKEKKIVLDKNNFFLLTFAFWDVLDILQNSKLDKVLGHGYITFMDIANWFVFGLLILQIVFFQKYNGIREIWKIAFVSIIVLISTILSGYLNIASLWIFIIAAKNIDLEKCIHMAYKIIVIMLPLIVFLFFLGIIPEYVMFRGNRMRHSLGFAHPNSLGQRAFQLMICHFYLHRNKLKLVDFVLLLIMCIAVYYGPNSQSSVVAMILIFWSFGFYYFIRKRNSKILNFFAKILFIVTFLSNVLSVYFGVRGTYGSKLIGLFDKVISQRFSGAHRTFLYYGFKWFGQHIYIAENSKEFLGIYLNGDNAYMHLLMRYGILIYFLFTIGYILSSYYCMKHNQYGLVITLFIFALYGIMENGIFLLNCNIFLLVLVGVIYRDGKNGI